VVATLDISALAGTRDRSTAWLLSLDLERRNEAAMQEASDCGRTPTRFGHDAVD
jgi:hypothetical protein